MSIQHPWHPMALIYRIAGRFAKAYDAYRIHQLKARMKHCGRRVEISPDCIIWSESEMSVGNNVAINSFTHIFAGGGISIGDDTMISACCSIASVSHPVVGTPRRSLPLVFEPVRIGRNVWLGTGAIVLPGVIIGDHAVIGAGAVVTRDIPERAVVVGNPARIIRYVDSP
jgi:acetyltransferase-like isoleucine patch superfamily enzyme